MPLQTDDGALMPPIKPHHKKYDDPTQVPHDIDDYVDRISAIRACGNIHIPHAREAARAFASGINEQIVAAITAARDSGGNSQRVVIQIDRQTAREVVERTLAPHYEILAQSLLIFGFSTFDAFLGTLLRTLYREQPLLVQGLQEKALKLSEIRACKDINDAAQYVIDKDISSILRESYDTAFDLLASRFGLKTLKKVESWAEFIECSQRRNLVTHCDAVVNSQYLTVCEDAGAKIPANVMNGTKLSVSAEYLDRALDLLHEIGVKLANTLWRKCLPQKAWVSEKFLVEHMYDLLASGRWPLAQTIGDFALSPPFAPINDLQVKMARINYAQALKWGGREAEARDVLNIDWSSTVRDFRLAVDVLCERYDNACEVMRHIGRNGELVKIDGYRDWPLFREFRKTPQFKAAFEEIYGEPFEKPIYPRITITSA
jgi:hypothetical protein